MDQGAQKGKERPDGGKFLGFDHIHFWVGNALQAAGWYSARLGFKYYAYKGLETGDRDFVSHVMKNHEGVFFVFSSPYKADKEDMHRHQKQHGDGVRDVAFRVEDCRAIYQKAISRGATSIQAPVELKDENGAVIIASVQTYGDTIHTFVQREGYKGFFMPGYVKHGKQDPLHDQLKPVEFQLIDHVVGNQPSGVMTPVAEWYEKTLDFHRFWSVDDSILHTEYSSLNSIVVSDFDELVKMPINEAANGKKISQIQEYCDYYSGSGVQHVALKTNDIITEVENMRSRGVDFLTIPVSYYDNLRKNLPHMSVPLDENIDILQKNQILVDYDDKGLKQRSAKLSRLPALNLHETTVIQRHNHTGFGAGNFKALFVSIEEEQTKRGNLIDNPDYKPK